MAKFRKLGRPTGHRMSMPRTMVSQLVNHERIETTVAKAKDIGRLADNMVQLGNEGTLCAARHASGFVRGDDVLYKLFTELPYWYKDRAGGYARLLWTRIRVGDAAPMACIEFIDRENELRQAKPPTPQPPQRARLLIRGLDLILPSSLHLLKRKNLNLVCDPLESNANTFVFFHNVRYMNFGHAASFINVLMAYKIKIIHNSLLSTIGK